MKFSIFLSICQHHFSCLLLGKSYASEGTCPGASFASQYLYHVRHTPHCLQARNDKLIRPRIPPPQHTLQLLIRPSVQVYRFDPAYMRAHSTVYARAPGSHERYSHRDGSMPYRMQTNIPRFQLAHRGSEVRQRVSNSPLLVCSKYNKDIQPYLRLFRLQSAQVLFPSSFNSVLIVC